MLMLPETILWPSRSFQMSQNTGTLDPDLMSLEPLPIGGEYFTVQSSSCNVQQASRPSQSQPFPQNYEFIKSELCSLPLTGGDNLERFKGIESSARAETTRPELPSSQDQKALLLANTIMNYRHQVSGSSVSGSSMSSSSSPAPHGKPLSFTLHQAGRWQERFENLVAFKQEYGHCCVPSHWPQNPPLAQWVKRQRSQWKLKRDSKHCNLTDEREQALNDAGFVWDSHSALWEERLNELKSFVLQHGHANIPSRYVENPSLGVWCKCQRRQFKLFLQGDKRSNMTAERMRKLLDLGFAFAPPRRRRT